MGFEGESYLLVGGWGLELCLSWGDGAVNSVGHLAKILSLWFWSSSVWRNGSFAETRLP